MRLAGLLPLVAVLTVTQSGLAMASASAGRVGEEYVAVAHLDPEIAILVNVVTGRLTLSGDRVGIAETVAGIEDPLLGHKLFRYAGGIPGLLPAAGPLWSRSPAPDRSLSWRVPRLVRLNRGVAAIVLGDGRKVDVASDSDGRVVALSWPPAFGRGVLRTRISYSGSLTTITDPFGVSRVYQHDPAGNAFQLVPASWHGTGYRHWIEPVLDGHAETSWVQYRANVFVSPSRGLLDEMQSAAGDAFGSIWFAAPASDGYINLGLRPLAKARHMESVIQGLGLLDITDITSTFNTQRSLNAAQDTLNKPLDPLLRDCHVSYGQGVDVIDITAASTITSSEIAILDRALRRLNAWAIVSVGGSSQCAVAANRNH